MAERSFKKINEFLDSVIRARLKVRRLEAGMVLLLGVLAVLLLAPAAVVSQVRFGYSAIIYAGLTVVLLGAALIRCWWLATRRPRRESIALDIEETHPDLGSNLISSLQLFPRKGELGDDDPTSPALIDALVNDTSREVESLDPGAYVSHAGFQRLGRLAGVLAVAVMLVAFIWPGLYPRAGYLLANAADLMPSRITHLEIWAERTTLLPGMPVALEVRTRGREAGSVELEVRQGAESEASIAMEKTAPHQFRARWLAAGADARITARTGRFRSRTIEVRVVAPPRVESIEVVQYPPEYTKLKPGMGKNGGHIRAYMGSEVRLAVKTNKPVQEALIALADGWRLPLNPAESGDSLNGKMILGGAGSYQVRLKDAHGFSNLAPQRYQIDIIPDAYPDVMVTHPGKDLTVEVDERVTVKYRASDDFGVKNVYLEARLGSGRPRRIKVWGGEKPQKDVLGRYEFDLGTMSIRPGGVLSYRFIAPDVDTVSGPKVGTSKVYRISIRDREAVMAGLERNLGEISNELLDLLGDYLEKDLPPEEGAKEAKETGKPARKSGSIEARATKILERIKRTRAMLRPKNPRETLSDMDLSTLERQLKDAISQYLEPLSRLSKLGEGAKEERERLNREIAARQEEATETLERLATMGEEIQRNVRVDRAGRTTESMIQRQRSIEQALEKMRSMGADEEALRRVEKELRKLREQLGELMQQMASLAQRMPAEFMNQRSMREMPMQDMMRAFERIREMMRQNNFQGALEQLRRLMSQLQRMRMALRGMQRQQMMSQRGGSAHPAPAKRAGQDRGRTAVHPRRDGGRAGERGGPPGEEMARRRRRRVAKHACVLEANNRVGRKAAPARLFSEGRTGETSRAREESRTGGARDFDAGPARNREETLPPGARREDSAREDAGALRVRHDDQERGVGNRLPEAAGVGGDARGIALRRSRGSSEESRSRRGGGRAGSGEGLEGRRSRVLRGGSAQDRGRRRSRAVERAGRGSRGTSG